MNKKMIFGLAAAGVFLTAICVFIFISVIFPSAQTATELHKMTIGYVPVLVNLPLFIALENDYFEKYNLKVEAVEAQSPNQIADSIIAGNLDGSGVLAYPVIFAAEAKYPGELKLFASADETEKDFVSAILVRPNSTIKKPEDLKNKKIGVYTGIVQVLFLKGIIKGMGMNPEKDITIVEIAPNLQLQGLEAGQYDALSTVEPYNTIAAAKGIGVALIDNPRVKYIQNPFPSVSGVLSADFIKKYPAETEAYLSAYHDAIDFIKQHPNESKQYLVKYTPIGENMAKKVRLPRYYQIGEENISDIQKNADWMFENKLISKNADVSSMFLT